MARQRQPGRRGAGIIALAFVAVALSLLVVLFVRRGAGVPPAPAPPRPIELDEARVAAGRAIYEAKCSGCHGREGVGENPADGGRAS